MCCCARKWHHFQKRYTTWTFTPIPLSGICSQTPTIIKFVWLQFTSFFKINCMVEVFFIFLAKFCHKARFKMKNLKMKWFWGGFNCQKSEKKIVKITKFLYLVPIRSPKHKNDGLIFVFSYWVCSQIWLNLPMDDHHFSYITIFGTGPKTGSIAGCPKVRFLKFLAAPKLGYCEPTSTSTTWRLVSGYKTVFCWVPIP